MSTVTSEQGSTQERERVLQEEAERRKHEEAEFHDRLRSLYEKDPAQYAYYTSNKKFYSVANASTDFVRGWLSEQAKGKRVLEYGCGSGTYAVTIARFAAHVTGIDISPEAIKLSKERAAAEGVDDKTSFVVMDAEELTFPPASFDVVSVAGVLHHLDLREALIQIHRVLAPGGKAIFLEALANNPLIQAYRRRTPHLRTAWETQHILRAESTNIMREYFGRVDVRYFHLAVLAAVPLRKSPIFRPVRGLLDGVDRVLMRLPGIRTQAWMGCFMVADPLPQVPKPAA
jgi:ubiquinone/menaquinone biosynthesis C-methylase UbiE